MAYQAHPTVVTGQIWAAGDQNTYVAGNLQALWVYTTKGDLAVCKDNDELVRVPIGADGTIWVADSVETAGVRAGQLPIDLSLSDYLAPLSGLTVASVAQHESSAANPKPNQMRAGFSAGTDSWLMFKTVLPSTFGSNPALRIHCYEDSATSGTVQFGVRIAAISAGDLNVDAKAFAAVNLGSATVPANAKTKYTIDVPLNIQDSWAKGDEVIIGLYRDTSVAGNATGTCRVTQIQLVYI